ncbi:type II and III secretion system protein, partial [PVC group bacterium]|nr:type II and III secretion system protein [PVC group bacterium]
ETLQKADALIRAIADAQGRFFQTYGEGGPALLDAGIVNDSSLLAATPTKIIPDTEDPGDGGNDSTSLYVMRLQENEYLWGIQEYPLEVEDLGILQTAPAFRTRVDAFNDGGAQIGQFPSSGFSNNFGGQQIRPGQIHVGIVDEKIDFDVLIKFLQTIGNTQILSNPKLVVTNNQEARIHVGERQAYITSTTTTGQSTSTVSEEVTFVDVGIQLSVIPTINDEGFITLKVKPEISSVISTLITPSGNQIPIIDTSTAETTVMVKSGVTVVIGGLRRDEKTEVTDQVPFLSKIPFLGFFFKQTKVVNQRTELLVLLTPYIIDGEHLILGDPRDYDFGATGGKKYAEYTAITDDSDYIGPLDRPEDRIKSYREYSE